MNLPREQVEVPLSRIISREFCGAPLFKTDIILGYQTETPQSLSTTYIVIYTLMLRVDENNVIYTLFSDCN